MKAEKTVHEGQCDCIFDLILARISILIERRRISDSRRLRKNLSGVNLRSFDGTTGAGLYDNIFNFEASLGLTGQIVETFVTFSFRALTPAPRAPPP